MLYISKQKKKKKNKATVLPLIHTQLNVKSSNQPQNASFLASSRERCYTQKEEENRNHEQGCQIPVPDSFLYLRASWSRQTICKQAQQRWLSGRFGGEYLALDWWRGEDRKSVLPHLIYSKTSADSGGYCVRILCPVGCKAERKMKGYLGLLPLGCGK